MDTVATPAPTHKRCPHCEETKPLGQFFVKNKKRGTRLSWCKECTKRVKARWYWKNAASERAKARERRAANLDAARKRDRELYRLNAESRRAAANAYTAAHPDKRRQYRIANAEHIKARSAAYRAAHKAEIAAYGKAYYAANKDAVAARVKKCVAANRPHYVAIRKAVKARRRVT